MASSSSSPSVVSTKHDVFLSFRGADTRHNFVSHLYQALQNKKIQTFKDDEKLNMGEEISPALLTAIRGSKISLIIFSENYGNSKWCLDELVTILECRQKDRQIVVPVFYKVDPTSVRNQTGNFGSSFHQLANKYESKEERWRMALKEAGSLSGWESSELGSEAIVVQKIIAYVLEMLKILSKHDDCDLKGLVGINSRIEKIVHLLDIESSGFRIVGIWGMGGIGKSTIAEIVFNKLRGKFESYYYLGNVRDREKKEGLDSIRDKLISELLKDSKLEIQTPRIGDGSIKDRLSRTKVLLVLDDIDDSSQLEKLIGERGMNQFGQGSRVIVTTRDKHVINAHDITCVYDMEMLDDRDALELFNCHALRPDQPMEPYLEISKKIVEYAQGVPLALKILGCSLHGKTDIEDWKGELKKLKKLPNMKILGVLKTSYDSLNDEEKDIFLDIVCFFKRANIYNVRKELDGFYVSLHSGMKVLADKSLIKIIPCKKIWNPYPFIETHDLIEEMGQNIVIGESKEVGSRSRIWGYEDACDVLTRNTGTDKIKRINFITCEEKQMNLDPQAFAKMHNLKFLKIHFYAVHSLIKCPGGLESLPGGLRHLEWYYYPLEYLPPTFNPTNLVQLTICSRSLKRLWSGRQNLSNLKVLDLTGCEKLVEIPDLSLATNLQNLFLEGCSTLDKILSSIQCCDRLVETASFIQHLTSLKSLTSLNLRETGLSELPSSIQYLTSLTVLDLSSNGLREIPVSIQYLTSLVELDLSDCCYLTKIPSSIQHLTGLQELNLGFCSSLKEIPSSIQHLRGLECLDLRSCTSLKEFPSCIQHLTSLIYLNLSDCSGVMEDIISIPHANSLINIFKKDSTQITKYPKFPKGIKGLEVDGILIEVYPSSIVLLNDLAELKLWNCSDYQKSSNGLKELRLSTPRSCRIIDIDGNEIQTLLRQGPWNSNRAMIHHQSVGSCSYLNEIMQK